MTKKQNVLIIGMFLIMIFGFTVGSMIKEDTGFSEKENRVLQQMPDLDLGDIFSGTFASSYEKYLSDQFFGRDEWIGMKTSIDRLLGKQEANGVYFAKDGYLIESHTSDFSTELAAKNIQYVADFVNIWGDVYGADHLKVCIVPNAVDILQDKLPAFVENTAEADYLNQIREKIPEEYLIDLEEVFLKQNDKELYYRTDHHWKTEAARMAYEVWAESISLDIVPIEEYEKETITDDFYGTVDAKVSVHVTPDSIERYVPHNKVNYTLTINHEETRDTLYDESALETRDKYAVFFGGNEALIEAKTEADSDRKLLILKDSYANCFLTFAMQDFSQIDIVDLRYFIENLNDYMKDRAYTDILLLYNESGFATESGIAKLALATGLEG